MRIEQLEIRDFRGIPEFEVEPSGQNLCLVGPNGSGKSSVIEAVDFLLTGDVKDLTGEGSGDLSIREHAPYLRGDIEGAGVEGVFTDGAESVRVTRTLSDRSSLEIDGTVPDSFEIVLDKADKGLHYLSRREILNFIVAQKQSRSEQIRSLLDLGTIKDKRLELQGAANNLDADASQLERELGRTRDRLIDLFEDAEGLEDLLTAVNELRRQLDGEPLDELDVDTSFRVDLESPTDRASANPLQSNRTKELLSTIQDWFEDTAAAFWDDYETIVTRVGAVRGSEEALRDLEAFDLIRRGSEFVDESSTECPLCLTSWDPADLQELLDRRADQAEEARQAREAIEDVRGDVLDKLTSVRTAVESLIDILDQHEEYDTDHLVEFKQDVKDVEDGLGGDLIETIPLEEAEESERRAYLEPGTVADQVDRYLRRTEEMPELDALEEAWDDLHAAFETFSSYKELRGKASNVREAADEMELVKEEFIAARDAVLTDTYDAIADRFEELYIRLHHDEDGFSPRIEPTETGLDIRVEFHGEGKHPPHALHSEGHQDSMGLCLFLALCGYLDGDGESLIMLDDVVMSIDAEHRRPLARMLSEDISDDFQLFITTHDKLWHRHLKAEGVVTNRNTVMFTAWSLEDGPLRVDQLADGWERIDDLLAEGDVPGAAHRLRHTAEWFLREACHQFRADVRFDADGRWMLGDFMGAALSKFKDLLKAARKAENSWGNDVAQLDALIDTRGDVYRALNMEQGSVNPNVHFNENEWATFTPAEMREVVDAFRDLYELFWCGDCGSCLRVIVEGHEEVGFRCRCGSKANWTLEEQP